MKTSPNRDYEISAPAKLLDFLYQALKGQSRTTVKSLLSHRQISINGKITSQFDAPLKPGDKVTVYFDKSQKPFSHPLLEIVYEEDSFLVVNKKSGLLTISTDKIKEETAYHLLNEYVKQKNPGKHIFIVHRLDRDTSGFLLFAKDQETQDFFQSNWNEIVSERKYIAVTEGCPPHQEGTVESFLSEDASCFMHSSSIGKKATTHYKVLKSNGIYALIEVSLETGRKNQIRVHMHDLGCPISGDKKYGARTNPLRRLALHAYKLRFIHPVTHQEMLFESPVPKHFLLLVKNRQTQVR